MITKAMILAAGLGTRLGKITESKPKALVSIMGVPMLAFTINRLKAKGIAHFIVNVHHHADQVVSFLKKNDFGVELTISDESDALLDTGGAIARAEQYFDDAEKILVHNVDVISDIDLDELEIVHERHRALVTLCVRKRESGRALLFDDCMQLIGWTNLKTGELKWVDQAHQSFNTYAFNGVYLINGNFARKLPFKGSFSIIDSWLKMAKDHTIIGLEDQSKTWFDLGTPKKIAAAEKFLTINS